MKTFSEVCKITGITRKALRGYDSVGLLSPTKKTENGYWLYNDEDVKALLSIQMLIEAGCERKKIKDIIKLPDSEILAELENVRTALEAKRKRIDGLIYTMKSWKKMAELPQDVLAAVSNAGTDRVCQNKNYVQYLDELFEEAASISGEELQENEFIGLAAASADLLAIGWLQEEKPNGNLVRRCIEDFNTRVFEVIRGELSDAEDEEEWMTNGEKSALVYSIMDDRFSDPEVVAYFKQKAGENCIQNILQAFRSYGESQCDGDEDFDSLIKEMKEER